MKNLFIITIGIAILLALWLPKGRRYMENLETDKQQALSSMQVLDQQNIKEGDGLCVVRGRIKNSGLRRVKIYEVVAKQINKNREVLDKDSRVFWEELSPGESRSFEISRGCASGAVSAMVEVVDVTPG